MQSEGLCVCDNYFCDNAVIVIDLTHTERDEE